MSLPGEICGLSGRLRELDLGADVSGGGRVMVVLRRLVSHREMLDLRRELCLSNVFWAENGLGLMRYL